MKYEIKIKSGEECVSLPRERVLELLPDMSEGELKALIALCASSDADEALEISGLESDEFNAAVAYLRGAKLIGRQSKSKAECEKGSARAEKRASDKKAGTDGKKADSDIINGNTLPEYSSNEIKRISESDRVLSSILDEAQQVFGKVFNSVEMNYIIAMRDHLGLDGEYILMLLQYFRAEGKALCYAVRVADSLVKKGISDPEALEAYIKRRDTFKGTEGKYRDLFGIGTRALTAYEEKYFHTWAVEMKMPFELVRLAFDRTVEKKGTPQKNYMNGILAKWHELGLKSEAEVTSHEQSGKTDKKATAASALEKSFDVNEFFNAALDRTYGKKE